MMLATDVSQFEGHDARVFDCCARHVHKIIQFSPSATIQNTDVRVVACSSEQAQRTNSINAYIDGELRQLVAARFRLEGGCRV